MMIITTGDNLKLTWWHINIYKCNMLRMAIYNDVNLKLEYQYLQMLCRLQDGSSLYLPPALGRDTSAYWN